MKREIQCIVFLAALVLASGIFVPMASAGFLPEGGTVSDPPEIAINSTILAWEDPPRTTGADRDFRWQYNPEAFAILSGNEHSRNATFIALRDTGRPEAISYGRDCSGAVGTDTADRKCSRESTRYWRIVDVPVPVAGFTVDTGRDGAVRFTDISAGSPESWIWDFGDGSGSAEQNPSHTYTAQGEYTVTLKTANRGGDDSAADTVEISTHGRKNSASMTGTVPSSPRLLSKSYPAGTVAVLHFNNAGPVEDAMGHNWFTQNLLHSDTISRFGGGSALFNGNAWIATNDTPDFSPGSENFTFSAWVYPTSPLNGYGTVWGNWWCCGVGGSTLDFYGGKPRIVYDNYGTKIITGTRPLPLNTWSNVVLQGKNVGGSSDITLYVNGRPNGTLSGAYNIRKPMAQANMFMGRSSTQYFLLQAGTCIDDFFIVKGGPALYEGPFTPPEQEFGEPEAYCGYNSCDDINNLTDYEECVACNNQSYCEGLCANSSCDLAGNQVTFIIDNYTCSYGNWGKATCGQNALLNWALEGDTAQFNNVLSTARWRKTIDCPNMGHSYAFESPGRKDVKMAGVTAKDIGFFHEIAAELPAGKDGDDYSSWRFFNYGESNITKGVGFPGMPNGQIPAGGASCYTKVTIRNILGIHGCLVIDDPPNIVETFYIDQNLQIQPNQMSGCGELATLKSLIPSQNSLKNYKDLPNELKTVLKSVKFSHKFATSRWEIDSVNRSMTIYTYGIRDEQEMNSFDGRTVNNYTIRMVHDSEFETTVQDVKKHITKIQENPDFQINRISMVTDPFGDPPANYVELWVNHLTPKNIELDNTMIDGWIILVYPEFQ